MMQFICRGYVTAPVIGILWTFVIATTLAVAMSFATGSAFRPNGTYSCLFGAALGFACMSGAKWKPVAGAVIVVSG